VLARADSAFYGYDILAACRRAGARFSVTARLTPSVVKAIAGIDEQAWVPIRYPNAIYDEQEQRWVSDAEVAEVGFTGYVVPTLHATAADAGRQAEVIAADAGRQAEVIAALPICVTDDPAKARTTAAEIYAVYGTLPSYRAMLDREGAAGPADIAIIGDEQAATERIEEIRATGVAEISAHVFGSNPEDRDRTRAFLRPPQALPRSNSIPAD
jgi:hypothetical protein